MKGDEGVELGEEGADAGLFGKRGDSQALAQKIFLRDALNRGSLNHIDV